MRLVSAEDAGAAEKERVTFPKNGSCGVKAKNRAGGREGGTGGPGLKTVALRLLPRQQQQQLKGAACVTAVFRSALAAIFPLGTRRLVWRATELGLRGANP